MSDGEPEVKEDDLADEEAEEEEPSSDTPSEDPLPTVGEILRQVRTWSVFDLLRLVTSLVHEVQARVVEEERAREDAALATRLGAPWRRAGAVARGKVLARVVVGRLLDPVPGKVPTDEKPQVGKVPGRLAQTLLDAGWNDATLGALVASRDDGRPILAQLMPDLRGEGYEQSLDEIWALAQEMGRKRQRMVSSIAQAAKQPRLTVPLGATMSAGAAYDSLVRESVELARKVFKSRKERLLRLDGAEPEKIESEETKRWAAELARFISLAELPAKAVAEGTAEPMTTWLRLCGNRRPRTLRQSARSWSKFHSWLTIGTWSGLAPRRDYGHRLPGGVGAGWMPTIYPKFLAQQPSSDGGDWWSSEGWAIGPVSNAAECC